MLDTLLLLMTAMMRVMRGMRIVVVIMMMLSRDGDPLLLLVVVVVVVAAALARSEFHCHFRGVFLGLKIYMFRVGGCSSLGDSVLTNPVNVRFGMCW